VCVCVCVCVCVFTGVQGWLFTESEEWARRAEEHYVIAVNKFEKNRYFVSFIYFKLHGARKLYGSSLLPLL